MNDDTQKPSNVTSPQQESDSALSRASATIGGISAILFYMPLIGRILSSGLAQGLDLGQMSPPMVFGMLLGLVAFVLGIIALFLKGRKRLAKIGIITGGLAVFVPLLIPLLA
jgi:hypothetical protein